MAHVLVGDVIGRSAEVGACLAVDVVKADGVGLGFQYISCAVSDAVVEGVRALVVQRKLSHVLDVFSVDVPHRGDVVLSCKAVSSDDVADWSDGSHAVDMEFILLRFLVDVGCVSNRYIFIFAPCHLDLIAHRVKSESDIAVSGSYEVIGHGCQIRAAGCNHAFYRCSCGCSCLSVVAVKLRSYGCNLLLSL